MDTYDARQEQGNEANGNHGGGASAVVVGVVIMLAVILGTFFLMVCTR